MVLKNRLSKFLLVSIALVMLNFVLLSSFSQPISAATKENADLPEVNLEKNYDYTPVVNTIANGIKKEGSDYVLDKEVAKDNGLTEKQIDNLENLVTNSPDSTIKQAIKEANSFESSTKVVNSDGDPSTMKALPPGYKQLAAALGIFVGVGVANTILSNAVNHGVQSACNKFQNTWGVTTACTVAGYPPK